MGLCDEINTLATAVYDEILWKYITANKPVVGSALTLRTRRREIYPYIIPADAGGRSSSSYIATSG